MAPVSAVPAAVHAEAEVQDTPENSAPTGPGIGSSVHVEVVLPRASAKARVVPVESLK
jgi:hypothetical protein